MTTLDIGRQAESEAAVYLELHGYRVIDRNWRTRYCEIDIVAHKAETIYFVEVKHRSSIKQGDGLDSITKSKLKQMRFAAEMWVHNNHWRGDYELMVIAKNEENAFLTVYV